MKKNRIWYVFAGCMLMYGSLMGVLYNCTGVLITGIIKAEGYTSSSISGYYTLRGFVQSIAMLFTAQLLKKWNIKHVVLGVGIISSLSYYLMFFYTAPWQWNISGILSGIATSLSMLLPTTVIKAWFVKKRGTFMGIFTMLSGILGAVLNPVVSRFIENNGWRSAALLLATISLAMNILASVLIVRTPAEVGCTPYGGVIESKAPETPIIKKSKSNRVTGRELLIYLYILLTASMAGQGIQMTSYIPQYSVSLGYPLTVGATMTSAIMIGNVSAKLLFGMVSDWLGPWKGIQMFLTLIGSSFVILSAFGSSLPMLYIACVMLGFSYMSGLGLSLVAVELFDDDQFETQYSRNSMFGSLLTTPLPYLISYAFDKTGSFKLIFIVYAVFMGIAIVLISLREKLGVTRKAASTPKTQMAPKK